MTLLHLDWHDHVGRRIRLRDLHILAVVVRSGSMAKGASQLGLSQPSVSESVATLEAALGVRLLDRSPRGIEPTIYAEALLKRANVVFDELNQGIRDIEFLSGSTTGEIRIGCPESLAAGFVPEVISRLSRSSPGISVHVLAAQPGEQTFRELRDRTADLLLGRLFKPVFDEDIAVEVLCEDAFLVVAGAGNPWTRRRRIALADLMGEPWVMFPNGSLSGAYIADAFRTNGLAMPRQAISTFSMQVRFHLLAGDRFLTVLHGSVLHFNAKRASLRVLNTDMPSLTMPIAIFALKHRTPGRVVRLFVEQAQAVARSMRPSGKPKPAFPPSK